ncbi:MAG: hypothetical protein HY905_27335 [Deltaproteobacteria bacterium]|nr:hypothetical protein [Deltaproteobacteria bacterium]
MALRTRGEDRVRAHVRPATALLVGAGLLLAPAARAEPGELVADVVIAAAPEDAALLEIALREPLDRLGVRVRWMRVEWFELSEVVTPEAGAPDADVRVWFDLVGISRPAGEEPRATVYLADGGWQRVLVRGVGFGAGLDEVAREELATIVLTAVEGILAGEAVGRSREEVREELGVEVPELPPSEPPPPEPGLPRAAEASRGVEGPTFAERMRLELGAIYEPGGFAGAVGAVHGIGLEVGLVERAGLVRWGGWLAGGYTIPIEVEGVDGVGVRLDVGSIRALGSLELAISAPLAFRIAVGGGVDIVRAEPTARVGTDAELESVETSAAGILEAIVGLRIVLVEPVSLWFGVGVDVDPAAARYVVHRGGESIAVLEPWVARPFGSFGLTFDILGGGD